ncbi:hypothetical protein E5P55_00345 [Candidatus Pinguicoccus supinus]|uniref:acetyl-CoA carboxytransferase n=1 Tax=Candidatus Pinguicoccus supinus TaxID=2529394 RepID=A0A7T0BRD2_9BACT|nr:hypothetical protein E5P55_00345 [Candidatus Pinguicoccus supinus]
MINKLNPYFENKYTLFLLKKYIYTVIVEFFLTKLTFIYRKILNLKKKIQFIKKLSFLYNKKLNLITVRENYKLHTEDFIKNLFLQFTEVSGDKSLMNDTAVVVGFGLIQRKSICVIGIEKGFSLNDKMRRNFGSAKPEGYRKILRTTILAEKFNLPVLFLIDTPGAYPGIESEERHISLTISNNIKNMGFLRVPTLSVVLSEGGSGGALSIGVTDYILMLQYSYYSVISPEGCSTIL